jgi:putative ABC transport system permease protein
MLAGDVVRYALGTMGRRKLRTALTSLGVTMAIAVIVALLSITQGLQTSVQSELNGLGTNTLTITAKDGCSLLVNDTSAIEGIDKVTTAIPLIQRTGSVRSDSSTVKVSIVGLDMDKYRQVYSDAFVAERGSIPMDPSDDTVVIGERVYDPGQNGTILFPIGSSVQVFRADSNRSTAPSYGGKVAGVLNPVGPMSVGALSDTSIYIPIEQAESFFGTDQCTLVIVKLQDGSQATMDEVIAALNNEFDGQVVVSSSGVINSVASHVFSLLDLFLVGVAGITLLIAGIGIMNTMTISLIERTREIGTLKSLGLKDRKVLGIFLCEASIVGLIGGLAGTVSGFALASAMSAFLNDTALLNWSGLGLYGNIHIVPELSVAMAVIMVSFGVIVSVLFSLYPAWRASRMSPMVALRHD